MQSVNDKMLLGLREAARVLSVSERHFVGKNRAERPDTIGKTRSAPVLYSPAAATSVDRRSGQRAREGWRMSRFTPDELRRAIVALAIIEQRRRPARMGNSLATGRQLSRTNGSRWGNATPNQKVGGSLLAGRLANLLGEDRDGCEEVAAEVFAPQRHRAVYDAMIDYAAELTGHPSPRNSIAVPRPVQRPTVRIVADCGVIT